MSSNVNSDNNTTAQGLGYGLDISTIIKTNPDQEYKVNDDTTVIDNDWVTSRFMVSDKELEELDAMNRYFTTTQLKFTDTTLGGNIGINPRPQYCRFADIRGLGRNDRDKTTVSYNGVNLGMGLYYSEAIDDNAQLIFMQFGVPKFNSLADFFTRSIDYEDSVMANTGRVPTGYKLGRFVGQATMAVAFPAISLMIWTAKIANKLAFGYKSFDFYYMEPAMHMYWGSVNTILTMLATELGILAPELMEDPTKAQHIGINVKLNQDDMDEMKKLLPGLISDNNYIDVFAIATKAQSIANQQALKDREEYEKNPNSAFDMLGYVKTDRTIVEKNAAGSGMIAAINNALTFSQYLDKIKGAGGLFEDKVNENKEGATGTQSVKKDTNTTENASDKKFTKEQDGAYKVDEGEERSSYLDKYVKALDSSIRDGGAYASFYVNYTGSVSESFSNSVGEIGLAGKIKSLSGAARNVKFDLAGGNIAGPIKAIADTVKDVLAGVAEGVSYGLSGVLQTITGGGYTMIPKKWDDSDMSLPSITYKIELRSPYGNVLSQLQNMYIPLAMLLAGALPLATGNSSYTSPMLCSLYNRGIQVIKNGMITSLSIDRGVSNLGFNTSKRALAIDVSFTVTDFSTLITAPVSSSMFDVFKVSLADDTPLGNYLAVLGSRNLLTNKYTLPKIKLRASRLLMNKDQAISPAAWGLRTGEAMNFMSGLLADHAISLQYQ